jgi:hypothetical protein
VNEKCEDCVAFGICSAHFTDSMTPCGLFEMGGAQAKELALIGFEQDKRIGGCWFVWLPELTPEDAKFTGLN